MLVQVEEGSQVQPLTHRKYTMLTNLHVKEYLSRLMGGDYTSIKSTAPQYPTIDRRTATVVTKTADYTITQDDLDTPTIFNNTGDSGNLVYTLPAVAASKGKVVRIHALAAQTQQADPQAGEAVNYNGSAVVSKYAQLAGVIGNWMELFCDGTQWIVTDNSGVVTKEA